MNKFETLYESIKTNLQESSLSRVWQFIEDPNKKFAVISPYMDDLSSTENQQRYKDFKEKIKNLGYGILNRMVNINMIKDIS